MIHSDQGREFENKVMQELCLLCGDHKTRTTPYHPESDGLVERFNRTLPMMLAMFVGENRDDWDDLLPAVMMAYRSSVHESTGYSPYRLMLGKNVHYLWTQTCWTQLRAHMLYGPGMHWKWLMTRFVDIRDRLYGDRRGSMIGELFDGCSRWKIVPYVITLP